jgi:hypothetical protein
MVDGLIEEIANRRPKRASQAAVASEGALAARDGEPTLHLRTREILVSGVDRFELAAVNGNTRVPQQAQFPAKPDKLRTYLADRTTVVLAEIRNRLVIGSQSAGEPHHLDVASGLALKPPARLNSIEIAVDVEL